MAVSDVDVFTTDDWVRVTARGGTRRERGSAIGAAVRGLKVRMVYRTYSETHGFMPATYTRYELLD